MSVFADTSGLYALLFESEESHADVVRVFRDTLTGERPLWTTSYVLVETIALLQSRVGLEPVRALIKTLVRQVVHRNPNAIR